MHFTSFMSATAVLLALTAGPLSAADRLATLGGVQGVPMSTTELSAVKGQHIHFRINNPGTGVVNPDTPDAAGPLVGSNFNVNFTEVNLFGPDPSPAGSGPGYNGLCGAALASPAFFIPGQNTMTGSGGGC